jgi:hypothetical protein
MQLSTPVIVRPSRSSNLNMRFAYSERMPPLFSGRELRSVDARQDDGKLVQETSAADAK